MACCLWIYFTQIKAAKYNVGLHQRVGQGMAFRGGDGGEVDAIGHVADSDA